MATIIIENYKLKIQAQQLIVNNLKREMDALYEDYDVRVGPDTSREEESQIEAICWAKEVQYNAAKHELSMMQIRLSNHINTQVAKS